jgi:large repetitive protein
MPYSVRPRAHVYAIASVALALVLALVGATGVAIGDTEPVTVAATVPSATMLDATGCSNGTGYAATVGSDSPVGRWKFDESSGSTAADSSGNANHLTHYTSPNVGVPGLLSNDAKAAWFGGPTGSNSHAAIADTASLSLTNHVSVEAWVKVDQVPSGGSFGIVAQKAGSYMLRIDNTAEGNDFSFFIHDGSSWEPRVDTATTVRPGRTYHVVGTYDGSFIRLYVDGQLRSQVARTGAIYDSPWGMELGGQVFGTPLNPLNGTLDEVAVYPTALSATAVQTHYRAGSGTSSLGTVTASDSVKSADDCTIAFGSSNDTAMLRLAQRDSGGSAMSAGPLSQDTVGYWPLNNTGDDLSPLGRTAALTGSDPAWTSGPPGFGGALDLDGNDHAEITHDTRQNLTAYTVEAWFKTGGGGGGFKTIVAKSDTNGTGYNNYALQLNSSYELKLQFTRSNGSSVALYHPGVAYNDSQWHHAAATVGSNFAALYVDGKLKNSTAFGGVADLPPVPIYIGTDIPGQHYFQGQVDEVRITPRVLSAAEIHSHYAGAISNYESSGDGDDTDWGSGQTTSMFGACLRAKSSAAVTATWNLNATCPVSDGNYWNPVAATTGTAGAKIASVSSGSMSESVSLRFGMRGGDRAPAGAYRAELITEIVAPNTP